MGLLHPETWRRVYTVAAKVKIWEGPLQFLRKESNFAKAKIGYVGH